MRRILIVLVVAALLVVLMAASVSPSFGKQRQFPGNAEGQGQGEGFGSDYGCVQHQKDEHPDCGWHAGQD